MWIYIFSLIGVFLENSFFFSGEKVFCIAIPFFTYILLKKRGEGIFTLLLVLLLISLQGERYLYFFLYFFFYSIICYIVFQQMECNQGSIFYLTALELVFYVSLRYPNGNILYTGMHGVIFLGMNYLYLKDCYKE